ncbi:MAG: hypothetical protein ACC661_06040, partial [Verrucomicrobiales bacterium]
IPLEAYILSGTWWATLLNTGLLAILFATKGRWKRACPEIRPERPTPRRDVSARVVIGGILAALVIGGALRVPRLEVSVYGDEDASIRHHIHGRYKVTQEGELKFRRVTWSETFWQDTESNNHVLLSVLSRLCHETWQALGANREGRFSAEAMRIPSLLAGLGTIAGIGILLARLGMPLAAILGAWLLALHPWHIRYSTEIRGYALNLFLLVLAVLFLQRALTIGRWRSWIGFALAQCGALYAYAGSVYLLLLLNDFVLAALLARSLKYDGYPVGSQLGRFLVANLCSAMIYIQLMAPCFPQLAEFFGRDFAHAVMPSHYPTDFWAHLALGIPWYPSDPHSPLHHAVAGGGVLPLLLAGMLLPLCALVGAIRLARVSPLLLAIVLALVLSAPLGYLHSLLGGTHLYIWYLMFALPGVVLFIAAGATAPGILNGSSRKGPITAASLAVVILLLFAFATQPQRAVIVAHSKEPLHEVIEAIYGEIDPYSPAGRGILTAGFWSNAPVYDPYLVHAWSPELLLPVMEKALAEDKPLYLTYGHRELVESRNPEVLALADDPRLFEPLETFYGLEEAQFTHYLLRFVGNADAVAKVKRDAGLAP